MFSGKTGDESKLARQSNVFAYIVSTVDVQIGAKGRERPSRPRSGPVGKPLRIA